VLVSIHHPLRIAGEVTTLDRLSGGRVVLGLGRGFQPALFRAFDVEVAVKRDRFDEALDTMLSVWSGEPFQLDGDYHQSIESADLRARMRPVQEPHPPIVVAAFGPKGLRQAARRALPYLASPLETLDVLAENYGLWRDHLEAGLDPRAPEVPVMRTAFVAADDATAKRVLAAVESENARMRGGVKLTPALARAAEGRTEDRVLVGTESEVGDRIALYRERLGMDLLVARTEVAGATAAECSGSLERLAELAAAA